LLDPDNPLESMARKMVSNLYNGAVENRMAAIKRLAGRLKVDGLVLYNSWPCKRLAGSQRAIKEGVARDLGLPLLFLEADSVDSRSHDPETLNQQIEDFVEVLG
ncbi:MAG TPA: 2-hydroxyacyl-CoA dehydratase family protein, partial [Dehalococcoidia bacterium]|nr:2-hydroxyacyl-CoA dehydratase family protein [Dehalococcoidia bacterium]